MPRLIDRACRHAGEFAAAVLAAMFVALMVLLLVFGPGCSVGHARHEVRHTDGRVEVRDVWVGSLLTDRDARDVSLLMPADGGIGLGAGASSSVQDGPEAIEATGGLIGRLVAYLYGG